MSLFFPLLLILKKCTNYAEESAHYACMPRQKRFTTVGDGEWLIRVLFYMLLGFHSLQFCPTASAFPARRVSHDFTLSLKVRGPRQACSIMNRLVRRVEQLFLDKVTQTCQANDSGRFMSHQCSTNFRRCTQTMHWLYFIK